MPLGRQKNRSERSSRRALSRTAIPATGTHSPAPMSSPGRYQLPGRWLRGAHAGLWDAPIDRCQRRYGIHNWCWRRANLLPNLLAGSGSHTQSCGSCWSAGSCWATRGAFRRRASRSSSAARDAAARPRGARLLRGARCWRASQRRHGCSTGSALSLRLK